MIAQSFAVAVRAANQLRRDRRFLGLSLAVPVIIAYMLWILFEGVNNPMFDVETFIVPAGAFMVHFITYILCTVVLVRERTQGTLARMFVNGYRRSSIIAGYLLAYSLLATLQSLLVLLTLRLLFVELAYDLATFAAIYAVIWLLAVISIALGILVSNFARNEGQVFPFIPLVLVPSVFFSGLLVPVENLPQWAQGLSLTTPLYYASETLRDITLDSGQMLIAGLVAYGLLVMLLASFTLREQS